MRKIATFVVLGALVIAGVACSKQDAKNETKASPPAPTVSATRTATPGGESGVSGDTASFCAAVKVAWVENNPFGQSVNDEVRAKLRKFADILRNQVLPVTPDAYRAGIEAQIEGALLQARIGEDLKADDPIFLETAQKNAQANLALGQYVNEQCGVNILAMS